VRTSDEKVQAIQSKYSELCNIVRELQPKADYSATLQHSISTFLASAPQKLPRIITTFDELLEIVGSSQGRANQEYYSNLRRNNQDLKEIINELKNANSKDYNAQAESIIKLTRQLRNARRSGDRDRDGFVGEIGELKSLLNRSTIAIENLNEQERQLRQQLLDLRESHEQLLCENDMLKRVKSEL
jgi:chromosome segregation ATPase